jgi:tyramine---L-glutamate ligase
LLLLVACFSGKSFKPKTVLFGSGDHEALKILLYEHVSSGGYSDESVPTSLLSEGFAMLRGLAQDFKAAGNEVTVLLDERIASLQPPINADQVVTVGSLGVVDHSMEKIAGAVDAAFIVAPEANHVLASMVECLEATGAFSLNCDSNGIAEASDKAALEERAKNLGLSFPSTLILSTSVSDEWDAVQQTRSQLRFPIIVKPISGAGCGGLNLAQNELQLRAALAKARREASRSHVMVQEPIEGISASVSLISIGANASPVSLNLQNVTIASPDGVSSYEGGATPLNHLLEQEAFSAAKRLVESFGNLRGYVGVDIVLAQDKVYVIEVNPRLTTSYVGLRKAANFNVAEAIAKAVLEDTLPERPETSGYACFYKTLVEPPSTFAWKEICGLTAVASPPFPFADAQSHYALLQGFSSTFADAQSELNEAKERVQQICKGGTMLW